MPVQYDISPQGEYQAALIGPGVNPGGPTTTVLNTAMQRLWLTPTAMRIPHTDAFAQGQYVARLNDAGEGNVVFPNTPQWRKVFGQVSVGTDVTYGRLYWLEIYGPGDFLEQVIGIVKCEPDRQGIVVSGFTGSFALKSQFEEDYQALLAPRDAWARYSNVAVAALSDNWATFNTATWALASGSESVANNAITLTSPGSPGFVASINTKSNVISLAARSRWKLATTVYAPLGGGAELTFALLNGGAGGTTVASLILDAGFAWGTAGGVTLPQFPVIGMPCAEAITLQSDGRWVQIYVNSALVGVLPIAALAIDTLAITLSNAAPVRTAVISPLILRQLTPFLLRGSDTGDIVLPGPGAFNSSAVGLRARYYNDLDLAGDANRVSKLLNPVRVAYAEQTVSTVNNPAPVQPGAATTNWSAKFFGAVYLIAGTTTFTVSNLDDGARLWVGTVDNNASSAIVNDWNIGSARTKTGTFTAPTTGWYPILLEYFADGAPNGCVLSFTPPGVGTYTDGGGGTVTNGSSQVIPSTSLSPNGLYDKRVQRQAFFDILQTDLAQGFGLQWLDVPQSLESGAFPCVSAPHARVGSDTDELIEWDDIDRRSGILNAKATIDSTDMASSIRGQGAGPANGTGGQPTVEAVDIPTLQNALFDMQAWADHTDANQVGLLTALLEAELGLRLDPWQTIDGDPHARDRLADTFPLTGVLSQMRWQPGAGVRLWLEELFVTDTSPRQIMQLTRAFTPEGRTSTSVGFRARPRNDKYHLVKLIRRALTVGRSNQRQQVTLNGSYVGDTVAAGGFGSYSQVALQPGDQVVQAVERIVLNTAAVTVDLEVNNVLQGANLGGPWGGGVPLEVDVTAYATPLSNTQVAMQTRVKNTGGVSSSIHHQLIVKVLRPQ